MLADARKSPGPAGSPSWWAHDTFNNHKLFPCGWADRQTDRIYLQGRNCSETVTAALRDGCGEVLGFHGSPGVCRGRTALRRCRMGDGQRIWATNKPSIYIFCFLFQEASPLGWGFWLKEFKAMRLFYFFIFFSFSLCISGVLSHLVQIPRTTAMAAQLPWQGSVVTATLGLTASVLWGSSNHHDLLGEQGNPQPCSLGARFRHRKKGQPVICSQSSSWTQITNWEGTLLSSLFPLPLCPALAAGSRNFPFPGVVLLISNIFSTWITLLILLLL